MSLVRQQYICLLPLALAFCFDKWVRRPFLVNDCAALDSQGVRTSERLMAPSLFVIDFLIYLRFIAKKIASPEGEAVCVVDLYDLAQPMKPSQSIMITARLPLPLHLPLRRH